MEHAQSERLLIVDGHAYAYRAFHAIRRLNSPDGAPTNAIFGFIKMLDRLRTSLMPSHVAVIWDGGLAATRVAEHPEYKAQRDPMPDALAAQLDAIGEYLAAAGVASLCEDAVEADDWIGTLARKAAPFIPVVIASSDKDFMQLVSEQVGLVNPNDKVEKVWTADDVAAKAGVRPEQIVDWLSLIGDAVDNIPGVPGVGPKTATDLLQQFQSVDRIYGALDAVKSDRVRESLRVSEAAVRRNQRLIALQAAGRPIELAELRLGEPRVEVLRDLYGRWGFRTMKAELEAGKDVQQALL
jgi:DNA polymerase-1